MFWGVQPCVIIRGLRSEDRAQGSRDYGRLFRESYNVASFEDEGRKPQAKKCEQYLEAGKVKDTESLLWPPVGMQPC